MKSILGGDAADIDLDRIIEGLERHVSDVTGALNALRRIKTWSAPTEIAGVRTVCNHGSTLDPTGIGAGQTLWANAYAILKAAARPMAVAEIVSTMRENGVTSTSINFENTLNSVLSKQPGLFVRVESKTWGLVEWAHSSTHVNDASMIPKGSVVPLIHPKSNGHDR